MAAIWHDIEIQWQGEAYRIRPTLDFINRIEQGRGQSIMALLTRIAAQDLPSGIACNVIAAALDYAGVKVTPDDVYAETGGIGPVLTQLTTAILVGCLPSKPGETQAPSGAGPQGKNAPRARKR